MSRNVISVHFALLSSFLFFSFFFHAVGVTVSGIEKILGLKRRVVG